MGLYFILERIGSCVKARACNLFNQFSKLYAGDEVQHPNHFLATEQACAMEKLEQQTGPAFTNPESEDLHLLQWLARNDAFL